MEVEMGWLGRRAIYRISRQGSFLCRPEREVGVVLGWARLSFMRFSATFLSFLFAFQHLVKSSSGCSHEISATRSRARRFKSNKMTTIWVSVGAGGRGPSRPSDTSFSIFQGVLSHHLTFLLVCVGSGVGFRKFEGKSARL